MWARRFLDEVFLIPEAQFRVCPDLYLSAMAPLYGELVRIDEPLSDWRVHDSNSTWAGTFESRLRALVSRWDLGCEALAARCMKLGIEVDVARWRKHAWCHNVRASVDAIIGATPDDARLVLVEDNDRGVDGPLSGRPCTAFPGSNGLYAGRLRDDDEAVAELERLRAKGFAHVAIPPAGLW